jgi:DNA-binding GntR family transcriptional regulator
VSHQRDVVMPSIVLDAAARVPIYLQLARQLADAIQRGALADARLPATRTLAALLGISRNTVLAAYDELVARGLIEARRGSGTRVSRGAASRSRFALLPMLRDAQYPARTLEVADMDGVSISISY